MPLFLPPPPPPLITVTEASTLAGNVTNAGAGLTSVYLYAFELAVATTYSGVKYRTGSTATGSADAGIYTFAGTLLANIGGLANVASTSVSQAFSGGNVTLQPGQYFMAFVSSNATDTYMGVNAPNAAGLAVSRYRIATNAATIPVSVVVLPSTTGGYSVPGATKMPSWELTVVGGL